MSGLKEKNMDMLLLLGCNTAHLDYDSIGKEFASYIGNTAPPLRKESENHD